MLPTGAGVLGWERIGTCDGQRVFLCELCVVEQCTCLHWLAGSEKKLLCVNKQ